MDFSTGCAMVLGCMLVHVIRVDVEIDKLTDRVTDAQNHGKIFTNKQTDTKMERQQNTTDTRAGCSMLLGCMLVHIIHIYAHVD